MRRVVAGFMAAVLILTLCPLAATAKTERQPGGPVAFIIGCCWGIREGTEWNEGADMHWREWCRIIPWVGIVFAVWDGIDCYNGMTAREWAQANGANWY